MGRFRERLAGPIEGMYTIYGNQYPYVVQGYRETCDDIVGNRTGVNPLSIHRVTVEGGTVDRNSANRQLVNYPIPLTASDPALPPMPDTSDLATRLAGQTGPLTPRVNVPLALYELKDIPRMLKFLGDVKHKLARPQELRNTSFSKLGAEATLQTQFGWLPLMQDLSRLMDFSETVNRRQRELQKTNERGGNKRRVNFDDSQNEYTEPNALIFSKWGVARTDLHHSETIRSWGSMAWTLREGQSFGTEATYIEAFRAALGLNPSHIPLTVWKALPWTWMIDWFTNMSNVISANTNSVFYKPSNICIMVERTHKVSWGDVSFGGKDPGTVSGGNVTHTHKSRDVHPATYFLPSMRLPFMDSFKLSVLGSLAIMRYHRR